MASANSKIELFNLHVKEATQGLKARGERTDDLTINLCKGCMAVSDKYFVSYIKTKKDEHDEGKENSKDQLIKSVLNKYVNKKRDRDCKAPSEEEKQMLSLIASLEASKKESLHISKTLKSQHKKDRRKITPARCRKTKDKNKRYEGKGNDDPWE